MNPLGHMIDIRGYKWQGSRGIEEGEAEEELRGVRRGPRSVVTT